MAARDPRGFKEDAPSIEGRIVILYDQYAQEAAGTINTRCRMMRPLGSPWKAMGESCPAVLTPTSLKSSKYQPARFMISLTILKSNHI